MGVYIKGMEMPTSCANCDLAKHFDGYNENDCPFNCFSYYDCPLIEVPEPHGRLADVNEMYEEFVLEGQRSTRYKLGEVWELNGKEIRRAIYRLPTVIPASKEAE